MAKAAGDPADGETKRETLEQFEDRFGQLSDRMEQAVHPYVERDPLPYAETQTRRDERAEASQEPSQDDQFLPGHTSKPEFQAAAEDQPKPEEAQGRGSIMVEEDAPEHNHPPPQDSDEQNRDTHRERMAQDDAQSRAPEPEQRPLHGTEEYYRNLADQMQTQDDAQGYGQSRDNDQSYGQG